MDRNLRKQREGIVTSNKMDKTITVEVLRKVKHPIYGKFVKKSSKLTAHDEENKCDIGDLVRVKVTIQEIEHEKKKVKLQTEWF